MAAYAVVDGRHPAVSKVPFLQGPKALLGDVLVVDRVRPCHLRIATRVEQIAARRFRPDHRPYLRATFDDSGADGRACPSACAGLYLFCGAELTFVAVKPRDRLDDPKVAETFAWVGKVIESFGWGFEVASEPAQPLFDNVRFLAGYRREQSISAVALAQLRAMTLSGLMFGEAVRRAQAPEPLVRAALLHLLWTREVQADLSLVLSDKTPLIAGGRK